MASLNQNRVTQRDLAEDLGVSHATVSMALRNSPKVSLQRRLEIQRHAQKVGYQPDAIATAFAHRKRAIEATSFNATIAWIKQWGKPTGQLNTAEHNGYWRGAQKAAARNGFRLEEFCCGNGITLARLEKILLARGVHCVVLPPHPVGSHWDDFNWSNFFAVRLGRSIRHPALHIVASDQVANTILALQEMRCRGYGRVGFVTADTLENGQRFKAGYLMAQSEMTSSERIDLCMVTATNPKEDQSRLGKWLRSSKPDAILTDADGVPDMLRHLGYNVPDDIGLAATSVLREGGIDAGIDQHPEEIGRAAVLLAISMMHDNARGVPPIVHLSLVEGTWVDGSMLPNRAASIGDGCGLVGSRGTGETNGSNDQAKTASLK